MEVALVSNITEKNITLLNHVDGRADPSIIYVVSTGQHTLRQHTLVGVTYERVLRVITSDLKGWSCEWGLTGFTPTLLRRLVTESKDATRWLDAHFLNASSKMQDLWMTVWKMPNYFSERSRQVCFDQDHKQQNTFMSGIYDRNYLVSFSSDPTSLFNLFMPCIYSF